MQKASKILMVKYLLDRQPPSISSRLEQDEALRDQLDFQPNSLIGISGEVSIRRNEVFNAARRVLAQGEDQRFLSLERKEVIVSKQEGTIFLLLGREEEEPLRISFEELSILSSDREERLQALERILREIGPTGSDLASLRQVATEREVSEDEAGCLLDALWEGVKGLQQRIHAKLVSGRATARDLVPDSLDYFDRFCGPNPEDILPEYYLADVLPQYRQTLLQRDFQQGLEICLVGSLRDDLCPGAWLEERDDNELWSVLEASQPQSHPFSLLGALDVALYRQHDERFRRFAEEAVGKLTEKEFLNADNTDLYQVLPPLVHFVLNRIHFLPNGALRAPFWKRMCAWMQAAVAIRLLSSLGVDYDILKEQLDSNLLRAGMYANILDLRREPIHQASELSPSAFQKEVVRRLLQLQLRHKTAGRIVPREGDIGQAITRIADAGPPHSWFFPGPLEGHRRSEELGATLAEEAKTAILGLSGDLLLVNMVSLSQLFSFDEETKIYFRQAISKLPLKGQDIDLEERLSHLADAALVAVAERDQELAKVIAAATIGIASNLRDGDTAIIGLQALLIASTAFEQERAWAEWLEEQLSSFAARLPAGQASIRFYHELQELKKVTKLDLRVYSRAEALASAAAS